MMGQFQKKKTHKNRKKVHKQRTENRSETKGEKFPDYRGERILPHGSAWFNNQEFKKPG